MRDRYLYGHNPVNTMVTAPKSREDTTNYVNTLRRLDAVIKAYRRAEDACYRVERLDNNPAKIEKYGDIYFALQDKRDALRADIEAYIARPARVHSADPVIRGQWMQECGASLIRRQQVQTACRLLGLDSRKIRF